MRESTKKLAKKAETRAASSPASGHLGRRSVKPLSLASGHDPVKGPNGIVRVLVKSTDAQIAEKPLPDEDAVADFRLSTDALNYHRIEWRLREERSDVTAAELQEAKRKLCAKRGYEPEEFEAALTATKDRPRLPFGWTAMDLAKHKLESHPVRLLNPELEASRYARGIVGLAVHLRDIQKEEPILLPVEQVREWLVAKKVVVSGTITKLVTLGLLEMTKAEYNTGSAREFMFRGVEGTDYAFTGGETKPRAPTKKPGKDASGG